MQCACERVEGTVSAFVMGPGQISAVGRSSVEERRRNPLVSGSKFVPACPFLVFPTMHM